MIIVEYISNETKGTEANCWFWQQEIIQRRELIKGPKLLKLISVAFRGSAQHQRDMRVTEHGRFLYKQDAKGDFILSPLSYLYTKCM